MINYTYFGLPNTVKFCKRCVISNQRPNSTVEFRHTIQDAKETINFDDNGVCDACNFSDEKAAINWKQREDLLESLLDKHRSKDGSYDVVVPGSGGKDSAYTAHVLKYKYGMNPLTVTWAPHLYTEIGFENFQNWMHVGGIDNLLFTPNGRLHRSLTREAFLNLLHPFQPFIVGQRIIGPSIAARFGIPLVMYGENQAEYGNARKENENPKMDSRFYSSSDISEMVFGGKPIKYYLEEKDFTLGDFRPYLPLDRSVIDRARVSVHYLGYYLKWDPQECFYYAAENTGFKPNPVRTEGSFSRYSSIDDKIDPFHYYTTLIKFGLGRASYDAAQEIRNDKIDRDEAIALVKKYDLEFPDKYFSEFCAYVSLTKDEALSVFDKYRSDHLWGKNDKGDWELRHPVWG